VRGGELRRGLWLMSALACGLGILTKGAVAVVLVLPPVLLVLALDRRLARPSWRAWAGYLMLAVGVAAPWFVLVEARHPGFVADFFWRHHVQRYVKPFDHEEPAWFYLPGLVLGTLPWALLLPGLVRTLLRHSRRAARRRPPELGFFLLCFAWGVLFFSLSGCKRAVYILPAFPPLALALGCYLEGLLPRRQASLSALVRPAPASALAWRAAVLALALGAGAGGLAVLAELLPVFPGLTLSAAFVAGLAIVGGRDRRRFSWAGPVLATFVVLLAGLQVLMPAYAERFALREAIREQAAQTPPEVPVACYPRSWDSVGFYLRRSIGVYGDHQKQELIRDLRRQPRTLMFIKSGRPAEELLRSLPAGVRFEPLGRHAGVTWGWAHGKTEVRDDHWASLARLSTE
jgi:4-amino-4-deoxy-L-arabinose transferase-like glycosyltransferase